MPGFQLEPPHVGCYKIHWQEIESFFKRSHKVIVALTVQEILDEHIPKKLA
ncbi:MAG TPA: hypothetical protein VIK53_14460 [Verrucomicrobiae bacterium]